MRHDDYGRTYTYDRLEANRYRFESREENFYAKKNNITYTKYVNLFYYDKKNKIYWLPPVTWRDKKCEEHKIEVKEIMQLWEGQQKTIDFCDKEYNNGTSSILVISETATGKSVQMLGIVYRFKRRTLITVPSEAIGLGIEDKLSPYCDARYLNGAKIRKAFKDNNMPDILITHRSSANNCWDIINGYYDLMLNDEQHHLSEQMKYLCNTFKGCLIVGFTGSPYRKEMNQEDFGLYFQKIYETGLKSLPVKVLLYKYKYTYSIQEYTKACDGLDPESPEVLRRLINNNDDRLSEIKKVMRKLYFDYGFKRIILLVDRRDYQEKIKEEVFKNAYLINGDTDKESVINELKDKDEFLIIGTMGACGEGFDLASIQCGILFYSTSREGSLEQAIGRSKRFYGDKQYAYRVDFQDYSKVVNSYRTFGASKRIKRYNNRGFEIQNL